MNQIRSRIGAAPALHAAGAQRATAHREAEPSGHRRRHWLKNSGEREIAEAAGKCREEAKPAPAGTSSQELTHRHNYACKSVPVKQYLQGQLKEEAKGCMQPVGYTIHT
jgi:hypothetical protein